MGAHAVAVGLIHDRVAVEHKMGSAVEIGGASEVGDFACREFEQRDIAIWVAHLGNKFHHDPAAVGTPLEAHAVVLARIGLATGVFRNFAGCQIHHAEMVAVLDKSKLLAVGRNIRMRVLVDRISHVGTGLDVEERHLGNGRRVREIGIFLARHRRLIYILAAGALRGIIKRAVVGTPADMALSGGSVGDLYSSGVFYRSYEHVATVGEGHHLAVGRDHSSGSLYVADLLLVRVVGYGLYGKFHGLSPVGKRVDAAVVGKCHLPVGRTR